MDRPPPPSGFAKLYRYSFAALYIAIAALFAVTAVVLIVLAAIELWSAIRPGSGHELATRFRGVIESVGLLTVAVAALELSQTVVEEEVQRQVTMSAPTRVRRFLSRFFIVIIVSLAIESLVAVFEMIHHAPEHLPHAASIAVATGVLLAAWGVFVRMNAHVERLEPEGIERAKQEDQHVE